MGKPDAPQPPDPNRTAAAGTSTNVQTAVANAFLNNVNQSTPTGSLDYNQTGQYSWTDPTTGSTYNIPRFTATQTLSPTQQAIQGQTEGAQYAMSGLANARANALAGMPTDIDVTTGAPQGGNAGSITGVPGASTGYDMGGPIQSSLGPAGDITKTYGPADNFSADRQRVEDALMARMNPQLAIEKNQLEQSLADQGIRYGSQAYNDAMMNYSRQANDVRFGAIGQAGAEQQRLAQMAGAQAAFQNQAQQQGYEQLLGSGSFANQAQAQQAQQNAAQAAFRNQALAQQVQQAQAGFNASQAARNQYMQEQYARRNQPINEITALLSGSQVSQPNFINAPQSQIPTTDVAGLINTNFNQQQSNYNSQLQGWNSFMGGILGLGAGAMKLSDRREKEDIDRIGTVFAASHDTDDRKKLPIYSYSYKDDPASTRHIGPMAQDVERVDPGAVEEHEGRKFIKPAMVMGSILRAA